MVSLPTVNAILNTTCAVLLVAGYAFIRRGRWQAHKVCMVAAFTTSVVFLVCYLYYHSQVGSVRFQGQGWIRPIYFALLISHTVLAAVIVPMVLVTLSRAFHERFDAHKRIARWTLPLWLYVSVTGVAVYLLLYHLYPSASAPITLPSALLFARMP